MGLEYAKIMALYSVLSETVVQRCSVEKVFLKFRKIHRKTPVP